MSCLYSSPWIVVIDLAIDAARFTRAESQCLEFQIEFTNRRVQQGRVPQPPAVCRLDQSFSLPKQAQVSRVSFKAQYQAFVRLAVGSSAAL
jgi:hypothetical protein